MQSYYHDRGISGYGRKIRVMALSVMLLFVSLPETPAAALRAQNLNITLNVVNSTVKKVMDQIEKSEGYVFIYNENIRQELSRRVTIRASRQPVDRVLGQLLDGSNLRYKRAGRQITLYRKDEKAPGAGAARAVSESLALQQHGGHVVKGRVVDNTNEPVIGATVSIKGKSTGAVTDLNGEYTLSGVADADVIRYSYIGMKPQEVAVKGKRTINVTMIPEVTGLNDVVVVGYGTMKKRDVTGAIASIGSKEIENKMATNVFDALQGSTAGVHIVSGSGQPGESSSIKVRGTSTFSSEGVSPLYIVDGAPLENIDDINPSDIVSVEVLKDAASAAIYGSRSANGVIIITTRSGKEGKADLNVKYYHSWGRLSHKVPQANRADRLYYDRIRRDYFLTYGGGNPDESIDILNDPYNYFFNTDNDYIDMMTKTGRKDEVDISVGGGNKNLKYFINTGYYSERGIIENTGYRRLTTRVNSDYSPVKWLSMGSRVSLTYSKKSGVNEGQLLSSVLSRRPYFSTYYSDGSLVGVFNGQKNPIALIDYTTDYTNSYKANFYQFFNFKFSKHLSLRSNINANFYLDKRKKLEPSIITDEWQKTNRGYSYNYLNWNWLNENYMTYTQAWGRHSFSAMAGLSFQKWYYENENLLGLNSSTDYIHTLNAFSANLDLSNTGTLESRHTLMSLFARITYDYKKRYLMTLNLRRDGSSRFAKDSRWGSFPSASLGWRFSDEAFMRKMHNVLTDGKIRLSYGITGNQSIGNYDYVYAYSPSTIYDGVGGVTPSRIGTRNLKWEETHQFDVGIDLNFLNSRLVITADYYNKYTKGLLANYQLPKETGYDYMKMNVGEISNRGFEVTVTGDIIRNNNLTWNAAFNISRNTNRIEKLSDGKSYMEGDIWWMQEGGRIGDFYGFKCLGVFPYDESNAFSADWQQLTPVFENGVFQYQYLLNGKVYDGKINRKTLPNGKPFRGGDYNWEEPLASRDGVIDDNDRMVIGNAMPDVTGGFNTTVKWKNLSLYLGFYYSLGGKIYNAAEHNRNMFKYMGTTPSPYVIYDLWTKPGDVTAYPRPYNDEFNNARLANSFYLENASFIRLQNVRLACDLPSLWTKRIHMDKVNVYFFTNNLLTFTDYSGFDPEFSSNNPLQIGKDTYRYPRRREFGLGLTANF